VGDGPVQGHLTVGDLDLDLASIHAVVVHEGVADLLPDALIAAGVSLGALAPVLAHALRASLTLPALALETAVVATAAVFAAVAALALEATTTAMLVPVAALALEATTTAMLVPVAALALEAPTAAVLAAVASLALEAAAPSKLALSLG